MSASPLFGDLLLQLGLASARQIDEALAVQQLTGQRLGEALISLGHVTREQLQDAFSEALGLRGETRPRRPPLGEILVGLRHITSEQLEGALAVQRRSGRKLGEILIEQGHCGHKHVYEALSLQGRVEHPAEAAPGSSGPKIGRAHV